jgi:hypothetical protein
MAHIDLESYYKVNLTEIENMMPWERDIYLGLLNQYVEEENMRIQQQASM